MNNFKKTFRKIVAVSLSAMLTLSLSLTFKGDTFVSVPDIEEEKTALTLNYEEFSINLDKLNSEILAFSEGDESVSKEKISDIASDMLVQLSDINKEIEKENEKAWEIINEAGSDILSERQKAYEEETKNNMLKVVLALNNIIDGSASDSDMDAINSAFTEESMEQPIGVNPTQSVVEDFSVADVSSLPVGITVVNDFSAPTAGMLAFDSEVRLTDEMKAKVAELEDAKAIYEYVKNTFHFEPYYGSRKGAVGTFEQFGGNDTDIASLLVAMLREKGYPARFVTGNVIITSEQAMAITGTDSAASAGRLLASQFIPVSAQRMNGNIVGYKMKHTWVEAYIPYKDYRADGNKSGDAEWIPLDPSFKTVEVVAQECERNPDEAYYSKLDAAVNGKVDREAKAYLYSKQIVPETFDYLPASLPYIVSDSDRSEKISNAIKDKVGFNVNGEMLATFYTSEICTDTVTLCYEPEESYDADIIASYGGIMKVPAYLVNVCPVIKINGKEYGRGEAMSLGNRHHFYTYITNRQGTTVLDDLVRAGSVFETVVDLQNMGANNYERQLNRAHESANKYRDADPYGDELLAPMLGLGGTLYFESCDIARSSMTAAIGVTDTRLTSLLNMAYNVKVETLYGVTRNLVPGNFTIDVGYNTTTAISYDDDKSKEKNFHIAVGHQESAYEGQIWEMMSMSHYRGISTISVMNEASKQGVDIELITKNDADKILPNLKLSDAAKQDIKNFANQGFIITTTTEEVRVGGWKGSAYIAIDPASGSGAYMISGGLAGGSTDRDVSLLKPNSTTMSMIDDVVDGLTEAQVANMVDKAYAANMQIFSIMLVITTASMMKTVAALNACNLFALVDYVNGLFTYKQTFEMYANTLDNYFEYAMGNEEAGRQLIKDSFKNLFTIADNIFLTGLQEVGSGICFINNMINLYKETSQM